MIPSCLPQKSQCVQAAINTSSIALFSKCLIATGTASAWSAATARHNWRTSASPGVTVSTAKTISSSEQLSENKPVLNKTLIINYFFSISIYGLLDEMHTDGNLLFPKGDSGPSAQHVSRGFRPHRWWGGRRTSSTTCTALPALYASGNLRQVTSTIWWRTAGWSARPTTRPPSREVSCRYDCLTCNRSGNGPQISLSDSRLRHVVLCVSACFKQPAMTDVILKLWPTCANCIIASKPIDTKLHKAQVRRITSALCTWKDQLSITLIIVGGETQERDACMSDRERRMHVYEFVRASGLFTARKWYTVASGIVLHYSHCNIYMSAWMNFTLQMLQIDIPLIIFVGIVSILFMCINIK